MITVLPRLQGGAGHDHGDVRPSTEIFPVGWIESSLVDPAAAPPQGDEGAPDAWLVLDPSVRPAAADLTVGSEILVLTWLHQADRDTLVVHPRGDQSRPLTGVFSTRSQDRPNPIGLHRVRVLAIEGDRIQVSGMEAIDGTPIVDIKPVLEPRGER
jgi:tRNA-Thr(GGU) m(6)t(6)A37 methyltransferase TsaA